MSRRGRRQCSKVDIAPVMEYYGADIPYGAEFSWRAIKCPFHNDNHASARMTTEDGGAFHCHGCDATGDAISLVIQRGDATDYASAIEFIEGITGVRHEGVRKGNARQSRREVFGGTRDYERGSSFFSSRVRRDARGGP